MSALRVLAALFEIDGSQAESQLKKLDAGISDVKKTLSTLATSLVGAFSLGGIKHFIDEQIEAGSAINDTAEKLGVSTQALQQFQFAAGLAGVGSEQAGVALQYLNKNLGEAIGGSAEQAKTFAELGISLEDVKSGTKNAADFLPQLAEKFQGMGSDAERTNLAMKLFGKSGASLLPLLKQGRTALEEMNAEFVALGGGLSSDFIKTADAAGDEVDKLRFSFQTLKSQVAMHVLPMVTDLVKRAQRWVGMAREMAQQTNIVKYAMASLGVVGAAAGAKSAAGWAKMMLGVPKDAGFWKTALGLGEIGLLIVGLVVLAALFEDFFVMLQGGDSLIGEWIDTSLGIGTTKELVNELRGAWEMLSNLFATDLQQLGPILEWFKELGADIVPSLAAQFVDLVRIVGALLTGLVASVKVMAQLGSLDFAGAKKTVTDVAGNLFGDGGLLSRSAVGDRQLQKADEKRFGKETLGAFQVDRAFADYQVRVPRDGAGNVRGDTSVTQTNGNTIINVNGAGEPGEVARRVVSAQDKLAAEKAAGLAALMTGPDADD